MTVIEAIRNRHSVRNYLNQEIEQEKIDALEALIEKVNAEGNVHFQFCKDAGSTFNRLLNKAMGLGSAPSVIACVGPDDETLDERIGYYGEQIVLCAQQLGLNTCWAGTYNKKNVPVELGNDERLAIVIAIGYGQTQGKERKTKSFDDVAKYQGEAPDWFRCGVEMALLAPTAINQQQFEIRLNEDQTVSYTDKGGILSKIDLGIVRCHFEAGEAYAKGNK